MARTRAKLDAGHAGLEPPRRGHNRTWRGRILREMRQVSSTDPVFVLDEIEAQSVSVADDGRSVPPDRLHLFRRYAGDAGGDPVHGGVGPGLVICKGC